MKLFTKTVAAAALMALFISAAPARAQSDLPAECKVAFVNLAKVLETSAEGKRMKKKLDSEAEAAYAPLKSKQKQLEQLQKEITALTQEIIQKSSSWSDDMKLLKQNELQNKQLQYQQLLQSLQLERDRIQNDLMKKKSEALKPLEDKLNQIMKEVGEEGGYCVVFDVSPPSSNLPNFNPIIYADPGRDITDEVISRVDK